MKFWHVISEIGECEHRHVSKWATGIDGIPKGPTRRPNIHFWGVFSPQNLKICSRILGPSLISMSIVLPNSLAQRVVCVHPSLGKTSIKIENMLNENLSSKKYCRNSPVTIPLDLLEGSVFTGIYMDLPLLLTSGGHRWRSVKLVHWGPTPPLPVRTYSDHLKQVERILLECRLPSSIFSAYW